jgi:hypothetical protein
MAALVMNFDGKHKRHFATAASHAHSIPPTKTAFDIFLCDRSARVAKAFATSAGGAAKLLDDASGPKVLEKTSK